MRIIVILLLLVHTPIVTLSLAKVVINRNLAPLHDIQPAVCSDGFPKRRKSKSAARRGSHIILLLRIDLTPRLDDVGGVKREEHSIQLHAHEEAIHFNNSIQQSIHCVEVMLRARR